jgi:uncharacterized repeat protein (TIGR01451 family)
MKSPLSRVDKMQIASFRIVSWMLAIALWLLLPAAVNTSAHAQTSDSLSSTASSSAADWVEFHRDNMRRWNPYETELSVGNAGRLHLKWKAMLNTQFFLGGYSAPAVVNGVVYVGSYDHNVYALNAYNGAKLWSYATGDKVVSSPAVANGVIYVGSLDQNLYALKASTGAKLWSFATGGGVGSSPAVVNGVVYIGSYDHHVYALNASTGAKLWSYTTGDFVFSSPAVVNGVVYFGSGDHYVYALKASTGTLLWRFKTLDSVSSSPAVASGVVYIGSDDHNLYALNATTGSKRWSLTTGEIVRSSPAVANGVVYIGSNDRNVYALNASTGVKLWSYTTDGAIQSGLALANGVLYIAEGGRPVFIHGYLYALNAMTGAELWHFNSGFSASSPTIVDGVIYIRTEGSIAGSYGTNVESFARDWADLFLRINLPTITVHQGDLLTYVFLVQNLGPANAFLAVLNTRVPAGTTFDDILISGTSGLGTCTHPPIGGTGQIVCQENSNLAENSPWTVRLTVKVTAPRATVVTESASTMASTPDPNLANNAATVSIKVQ